LDAIDNATERASSEGAVILLTPEHFIITPGVKMEGMSDVSSREVTNMIAEEIPDPKNVVFNPCTQDTVKLNNKSILKRLSCIAKKRKLYLIVSLVDKQVCLEENCSSDGHLLYNTQVAFDDEGNIVAKYHKYHLYAESDFNPPETPELVFFDTKFGARIGLFVCFDRMFKDPIVSLMKDHKVTTLALSTYFYDEHPFLLSHQIDEAWSRYFQVNIISSNQRYPLTGTTGSGIYSSHGYKIYEHDSRKNIPEQDSILLVSSVPV